MGVDLSAAVADHGRLAEIVAAHAVRRGVKAAPPPLSSPAPTRLSHLAARAPLSV